MEGRLRAAERAHDLAVTSGWWAAALDRAEKMPSLAKALGRKQAKQPSAAIIDTMLTMKVMGAPFEIRRVKRS